MKHFTREQVNSTLLSNKDIESNGALLFLTRLAKLYNDGWEREVDIDIDMDWFVVVPNNMEGEYVWLYTLSSLDIDSDMGCPLIYFKDESTAKYVMEAYREEFIKLFKLEIMK